MNISQKIFHKNGYKEVPFRAGEYCKKIGKKNFPRFHAVCDNGEWKIHIDKKRRHGFFQKWMGFVKRNNIIKEDIRTKRELALLKLDVNIDICDKYSSELSEFKIEIDIIKNKINSYKKKLLSLGREIQ